MKTINYYKVTLDYPQLVIGKFIKDHVNEIELKQGFLLVYTINNNEDYYYLLNTSIEINNRFIKDKVAIEIKDI